MNELNRLEHLSIDSLPVAGEVGVWHIALNSRLGQLSDLLPILSREENERVKSIRSFKRYCQFVMGRVCLRLLLSKILGQFEINYTRHGKPYVKEYPDIHFNLSHSYDCLVLVVSRSYPVGVDIEKIINKRNYQTIAQRYFSPYEQATLKKLPASQQLSQFYQCWTQKEAFIKARGKNLPKGSRQFDVTLALKPQKTEILLPPKYTPSIPWYNIPLSCQTGYVGALAVQGKTMKACFHSL